MVIRKGERYDFFLFWMNYWNRKISREIDVYYILVYYLLGLYDLYDLVFEIFILIFINIVKMI